MSTVLFAALAGLPIVGIGLWHLFSKDREKGLGEFIVMALVFYVALLGLGVVRIA